MKEIKAFIRPNKANDVYKGLKAKGYCCVTLTEGEGTGKYSDPDEDFPSFKFPFMHGKIVKLEIVCKTGQVSEIIKIIQKEGRTGYSGDGLIYVSNVEELYRVKDESKGEHVLH